MDTTGRGGGSLVFLSVFGFGCILVRGMMVSLILLAAQHRKEKKKQCSIIRDLPTDLLILACLRTAYTVSYTSTTMVISLGHNKFRLCLLFHSRWRE